MQVKGGERGVMPSSAPFAAVRCGWWAGSRQGQGEEECMRRCFFILQQVRKRQGSAACTVARPPARPPAPRPARTCSTPGWLAASGSSDETLLMTTVAPSPLEPPHSRCPTSKSSSSACLRGGRVGVRVGWVWVRGWGGGGWQCDRMQPNAAACTHTHRRVIMWPTGGPSHPTRSHTFVRSMRPIQCVTGCTHTPPPGRQHACTHTRSRTKCLPRRSSPAWARGRPAAAALRAQPSPPGAGRSGAGYGERDGRCRESREQGARIGNGC